MSKEVKEFVTPIIQMLIPVIIVFLAWTIGYGGLTEMVMSQGKRLDLIEPKVQTLEVRSAVQLEQNRQIIQRLEELKLQINTLSDRQSK
jgi:hypothetical protein